MIASVKIIYRAIACVSLCASLTAPSASSAWLIQPPAGSTISEEVLEQYSENSAQALASISDFFGLLSDAELNHTSISQEGLRNLASNFEEYASIYVELADNGLGNLNANWPMLFETDSQLALVLSIYTERLGNALDTSEMITIGLSEICNQIGSGLRRLSEFPEFSPENPTDLDAREALSTVTTNMTSFVILGNAASSALGLADTVE
jgi:hypothetical protein